MNIHCMIFRHINCDLQKEARMRKLSIIIFIVLSAILTSCENSAKFIAKSIDLKDAKYLISFSESDMKIKV